MVFGVSIIRLHPGAFGWFCICPGKIHLHVVFVGQSCFWDWYGWEVGGGLERLSVEKGSSKKSYFKV